MKANDYIAGPFDKATILASIKDLVTNPANLGWDVVDDTPLELAFPGTMLVTEDVSIPSGQDLAIHEGTSQLLFIDGADLYAQPLVNDIPGAAVLVAAAFVERLATETFYLGVAGDTLVVAERDGTRVWLAPIDPLTGAIGTAVEQTVVPSTATHFLQVAAGFVYQLGADGHLYLMEVTDGAVTAWTDQYDAGTNLDGISHSTLAGNSKRLFYVVWNYKGASGDGMMFSFEIDEAGVLTYDEHFIPNPQNSWWNNPSNARSRIAVANSEIVFYGGYSGAKNYAYLDVETSRVLSLTDTNDIMTGEGAFGAAIMTDTHMYRRASGQTRYTAVHALTPDAFVARKNNGVGRDKYVRIEIEDPVKVRMSVSNYYDPATGSTTVWRKTPISLDLDSSIDAVLIALGGDTHLALISRQGTQIQGPLLIAEIEPFRNADGSLLFAGESSLPKFGIVNNLHFQGSSDGWPSGIHVEMPYTAVNRSAVIVSHFGVGYYSRILLPRQLPTLFGGAKDLIPNAVHRTFVVDGVGSSNRMVVRGFFGADDCVLFCNDTQGAVEDSVDVGGQLYTIAVRVRDGRPLSSFDLLVKE